MKKNVIFSFRDLHVKDGDQYLFVYYDICNQFSCLFGKAMGKLM